MSDVFISYKRSERARVVALSNALSELENDVWFDARLEAGSNTGFDAEIEREVKSAKAVLVCWTNEAIDSNWVRGEAKKGLDRDTLIPIMFEKCDPPVPFNVIESIDFESWNGSADDDCFKRLIEEIKKKKDLSAANIENERKLSFEYYSKERYLVFPEIFSSLLKRHMFLRKQAAQSNICPISKLSSAFLKPVSKPIRVVFNLY